jgi:hypothetical protein
MHFIDYWKDILEADGVPALVSLLSTQHEVIQATAASVLCNIGDIEDIREAMCKANAIPILISLLQSSMPIIHSRAAVILADVSCVGNMKVDQGTCFVVLNDSRTNSMISNAILEKQS